MRYLMGGFVDSTLFCLGFVGEVFQGYYHTQYTRPRQQEHIDRRHSRSQTSELFHCLWCRGPHSVLYRCTRVILSCKKCFCEIICHSVIIWRNYLVCRNITEWQICLYLQYLSLICHKFIIVLSLICHCPVINWALIGV